LDPPPVGAAAGAAAAAVSHIPQSLKKNFSLIALMHLHHQKKIFTKNPQQHTTGLTPIPEHTDNPLVEKKFF
jgi:hypothetical protein